MNQKIVLGTVQLGVPYGINNVLGKPNQQQAHLILREAQRNGIDLLDSADAYGDSLQVIGSFLKTSVNSFEVISKFIGDDEPLVSKVDRTLVLINQTSLYAYLYHRYSDYESGNYSNQLNDLKKKGKIKRVGVSLYTLQELERVVNDESIDLIQIPLNLFDLNIEKKAMLREAKSRGKEIHVRSIFLQGLFFKDPKNLTGNLKGLEGPLRQLIDLVASYELDMSATCLSFALIQSFVDRVIIGVDSAEQLEENFKSVITDFSNELLSEVSAIQISDESLLNPANWKP